MEFGFTLVLFVIILILIIQSKQKVSKLSDQNEKQNKLLIKMNKKIEELTRSLNESKTSASQTSTQPSESAEKAKEESWGQYKREVVQEEKPPIITTVPKEEKIEELEEISIEKEPLKIKQEPTPVPIPAKPKSTTTFKPKPPKPNFWERNPDLEKFIGENLINKIGIAILVLGIGYFVKYAIDKEWINEIGRVFIGILAGGILLGTAHRLRKNFKAFSSVLIGGGLTVFYFTIGIAFHDYQLIPQTAAFVIMVVITGFAVLLSLVYDRQELAVLSLIGGFATPFMLSTGEGNYIVLFTYLMILDVGMLVLSSIKKWNLISLLPFIFTVLIFGSWLLLRFPEFEELPTTSAFLFASGFYLIFHLMQMNFNLRKGEPFTIRELVVLVSNTAIYYSAGMFILNEVATIKLTGLFTAGIGVFNFLFAFYAFRKQQVDRKLFYLLIGIVLTFISLTAPVQLEGNHITLFWAAETALLLWLSDKSQIRLIRRTVPIIFVSMLISLAIDYVQIYGGNESFTPLLNSIYITSIVAVLFTGAQYYLLSKANSEKDILSGFPEPFYKILVGIILVILIYTSNLLELSYQLDFRVHFSMKNMWIGVYNYVFVVLLLWFISKKSNQWLNWVGQFLSAALLFVHVSIYHYSVVVYRNSQLEEMGSAIPGILVNYIGLILIAYIGYRLIRQTLKELKSPAGKVSLWLLSIWIVIVACQELQNLVLMIGYTESAGFSDLHSKLNKTGYTIVLGLFSFLYMIYGMIKKEKIVRIISLSFFAFTLLKLFLYDIRDASEGGRIAAFIFLGVLLLTISFMYQKLKVLILDETASETNQKEESHEE